MKTKKKKIEKNSKKKKIVIDHFKQCKLEFEFNESVIRWNQKNWKSHFESEITKKIQIDKHTWDGVMKSSKSVNFNADENFESSDIISDQFWIMK